jgi:hypothetical protein
MQTMSRRISSRYGYQSATLLRLYWIAATLCTLFGLSASRALATDAVPITPASAITIRDVTVRDVTVRTTVGPELKGASDAIPSDASVVPAVTSQLWMVSTRNLSANHACQGHFNPQVSRFACNQGWLDSSWDDFQAAEDPRLVTTIFIDGNDTDAYRADRDGRTMYQLLTQSPCSRQPVRFVIWSWPADWVRGTIRNDAQVKACRTSVESYFVAHFVNKIGPEARVSILGYSFGGRITAGALHVLAGGNLDGRRLKERHPRDRSLLQVMLLAPALDNDWLLPGKRNGLALSQVERMLLTFNPCDRVLQFYPVLSCGPDALGYTGLAGPSQLGPDRERLLQMNISGIVGKRHDSHVAYSSPSLMARVRSVLLFEETAARQAIATSK